MEFKNLHGSKFSILSPKYEITLPYRCSLLVRLVTSGQIPLIREPFKNRCLRIRSAYAFKSDVILLNNWQTDVRFSLCV